MSEVPGFLRKSGRIAAMTGPQPVRCGSFGLALQAAPWSYTLLHDRSDDLLLWITRGQGRVITGGTRRGIAMNSALYLPAGTLFSVDLPPSVQALYVECPPGALPGLPQEALLMRVREGFAQAELTGEIDAMTRETGLARPYLSDALDGHLRLIAVWLRRQIVSGAAEASPDGAAQSLVRRYVRAVMRDFHTPRLTSEYAAMLDVTPTHLTRSCRAACGKTANGILMERKLHAARVALETTGTPVGAVASSLGFSSPAYFSRFVQSRTGQSPSALRLAARGRRGLG